MKDPELFAPSDFIMTPSDFVAAVNQTLEVAYGSVLMVGELSNYRVSKNKWVYFDLKDDTASVKFFGTVYSLPGVLEDGMMLQVRGTPKLHPLFGFSVTAQSIRLSGEGTIKKAFELMMATLTAEGLFEESRKRRLPYPPEHIGLITSRESAAYADFTKILNARWGGVRVQLADVQVQGEAAPAQIVDAIAHFNNQAELPEVLVLIRGGGSADDLQAFSTESVTRAVAASRIPTLVAIGHEVDTSLAELAADRRASTPSNAAEFLTPDKAVVLERLQELRSSTADDLLGRLDDLRLLVAENVVEAGSSLRKLFERERERVSRSQEIAAALNPERILARGYGVVTVNGATVRQTGQVSPGDRLNIRLSDGMVAADAVQ